MTSVIDCRFAGGAVSVSPAMVTDEYPGVHLEFPGYQLDVFPEEAVRLAVSIIAAAHEAEHPRADWP